jgi:hypothetical protein
MAKKKHHFSHTHTEYHHDGSATIHHVHESDPKKDVKHAVEDLDGVHDSIQDHLGSPNEGEAEANAGPAQGTPQPTQLPMPGPAVA